MPGLTEREVAPQHQTTSPGQSGRGAVFLVAAWLFCYASTWASLVSHWWNNEMYSYGFLIPPISLYLAWSRRHALARSGSGPAYATGAVTLTVGLLMYVAGHAGGVLALQEVSLVVTLAASVLLLWGWAGLKALGLPVSYLILMVPVWGVVTDRLHAPFQMFSANLGIDILHTLGIPAYRQGIFIELPRLTLEVAQACSGVNYLIAVFAIGIPLASLYLGTWWARITLLVFAVGVAALSNGFRVALIGALNYYGIGGSIHGPFHLLQGLFVSAVGYGALFGGLLVLHRYVPQQPRAASHAAPAGNGPGTNRVGGRSVPVVLALVFLAAGAYPYARPNTPAPVPDALEQFPRHIAGWSGTDTTPGLARYGLTGVDREVARRYAMSSGEAVTLYIGYYRMQGQGKELVTYRTREMGLAATPVAVRIGDQTVTVNQVLRSGPDRELVWYWYDVNGRPTAGWYEAKAYTVWDVLRHGRSNGALVMVVSPLAKESDAMPAVRRHEAFLREAFATIRAALPRG